MDLHDTLTTAEVTALFNSHRLSEVKMTIGLFVASVLMLTSAYSSNVAAQLEPTLIVTTNNGFDGIDVGDSFAINCTFTLPVGYVLDGDIRFKKEDRYWRYLTRNTTVENTEDPARLSVAYYSSSGSGSSVHTFELTFASVLESDFGLYRCGTSSGSMVDFFFISVGFDLSEDKPTIYVTPSENLFKGAYIVPNCIVKNVNVVGRTVEMSAMYPNGTVKVLKSNKNSFVSGLSGEGLSFTIYTGFYDEGPSDSTLNDLKKMNQDVKFVCSVTLPNGGPAMTSESKPIIVMDGPKILGENLLGVNVGETTAVTATFHVPLMYQVKANTWNKLIDMNYQVIAEDNAFRDDLVDLSRYDLHIDESNGDYTNTITIANVQESDMGYYMNSLTIEGPSYATVPTETYTRFFKLSVGYGLSPAIPLCELRSEIPIPMEEKFRMDCTLEKSKLSNVDVNWKVISGDGILLTLDVDNSRLDPTNVELVNYMTSSVTTKNTYTDYIGSRVVCSVTSPDLPGVVNNCTLGPFMAPITTTSPTTTTAAQTDDPGKKGLLF